MKKTNTFLAIAALGAFCLLDTSAVASTIIDINKSIADNGIQPDLIYWNFDGTAEDASPNQLHGTLDKGSWGEMPTYVEGKFGEAVYLQGYANINHRHPNVNWPGTGSPDNTKLDVYETSFSGGAWVQYQEIRLGVVQTSHIIERGQSVSSGTGYNFFSLRLHKDANDDWKISFTLGHPTKGVHTHNSTVTTTVFNDMDWHHIGFSFEYNPEGSNLITLFLDGEQFGSVFVESFDFEPTSTASQRKFTVGERGVSNYTSDFNGRIDDVFLTTGVYTFQAIPEPSTTLLGGTSLLAFASLRLFASRKRR